MELAIVNDNRQVKSYFSHITYTCISFSLSQYIHHGRDLSATVQNALDVVNAADLVGGIAESALPHF